MACRHELGGDTEDFCHLTLSGRGIPLVQMTISSYQAYSHPYFYTINGTRGGLVANPTEIKWKNYNPTKAPRQKFWHKWSLNRQYPRETLPWVEDMWTPELSAEQRKQSSGYTLTSFASGVQRFYDNLYQVLRGREKLLITIPQVRKQIAIIEEAHRQNPAIWKGYLPPCRR